MHNHTERQRIQASLQTIAQNVEQHMAAHSMSEVGLADATGLSQRTIGNFLRPENRKQTRGTSKAFPSGTIANLVKIAAAFNVEAWELMRGSDGSARVRFHAAIEAAYAQRHHAEC